MSVILRGPFGPIVATLRGEPAAEGRPLDVGDPIAARAWLRRLAATPGELSRLFALAGRRHPEPLGRLDDADGIERLARWLAAGEIRLAEQPTAWLLSQGELPAGEEAPSSAPVARSVDEPAEGVAEERTFGDEVDAEASAAVLREAAQSGVPFCEKCEKAAREAAAARASA